jgi:L-malate glycosyltransferase
MMEVNQFHPSVRTGDAIGDDIINIRSILTEWGYKTNIYCEHFNRNKWFGKKAKDYREYASQGSPDNVMLIHYSIGSKVFKRLMQLPDKKILIYHNITPPEFFKGISETTEQLTIKGQDDLLEFADYVDLGVGDSEYNRMELEAKGYKKTTILPIIFNPEKYNVKQDNQILAEYDDDWTNIIFVSRISPNKKQEDIIKTFFYLKKINPKTRLFLIGSDEGMDVYSKALKKLVNDLKLEDVHFTGHVTLNELVTYYKISDAFLGMSAHEGFGVPFLECMHFKVPILAYNCTATPYTLGDSGILINKKEYLLIAELINRLVEDDTLRNRIIDKQTERLKDFSHDKSKQRLKEIIDSVL